MGPTHSVARGLGCASVFPAGLIGFAGLTDYAGPRGWLGIAEFIGWTALCVAVGLAIAALIGQWHEGGRRRWISALLGVTLVAAFTYAPYWLGLHAPMRAKIMYTTTLQVLGSVASAALVLSLAWILWDDRRRS